MFLVFQSVQWIFMKQLNASNKSNINILHIDLSNMTQIKTVRTYFGPNLQVCRQRFMYKRQHNHEIILPDLRLE